MPALNSPRIMIVAGEASGDMHGARLIAALKAQAPGAQICGIGGPELTRQGVEILYDASRLAVVGIVEVLSHFRFIREAMRALEKRLREQPPDLLILIDYPDFNLILAKKAKRLGIPVFYYISPQVWAWRSGRVKTIKKLVDRMAVILPFEQEFYRKLGMRVDFVGHPLMDAVQPTRSREDFLQSLGIDPESTVIGILPGSRKREIAGMLPVFLAAAKRMREQLVKPVFVLPLAPTLNEEDLLANGLGEAGVEVRVVRENRYDLMGACNAVMAASGTVSLELAILDVPMVISYRVSPLTYFLGRRLIKVQYASLVNLVAGREVVPELLQDEAVPEKIADATLRLIKNQAERTRMLAGLAEVRERLGGPGASERSARLALDLARSAS
ncbi:MAG: lipid-A-disaccharide synthase [Desulfurivibrionaceae bacterium]|jgi:lipid-A-disaccharide synthase|nr:lipid-A-disaccharide synthase [Pseudomonadota bacterium]MCG2822420.1 lipid-A-disaccharide synthase [Desulfobulbaceae bacterium]MDP2002880.1 lipid-A-disaccharide synthase [Desulfurivibrionaceae bacterium]PKN20111.1 MAG: lipid-A-disaccharide synthase [Deltaproteobacteria bacterium HGW-Deltaproteobacteria-3]MBU4229847.1 lipid-A-disaccharide synthase [Pseudomonadota bacterium]